MNMLKTLSILGKVCFMFILMGNTAVAQQSQWRWQTNLPAQIASRDKLPQKAENIGEFKKYRYGRESSIEDMIAVCGPPDAYSPNQSTFSLEKGIDNLEGEIVTYRYILADQTEVHVQTYKGHYINLVVAYKNGKTLLVYK